MAEMNTRIVGQVSALLSGRLPAIEPGDGEALVADLHSQATKAPTIVGDVTGLGEAAQAAAHTPVYVVDRSRWSVATAQSARSVLKPYMEQSAGPLSSRLQAVEFAAGLAPLSRSVLGQYDPFSGLPGRLLLVAPNLHVFAKDFDLKQSDVALWVCIHELTHAVQFNAAPWLLDYLLSRAHRLLETYENAARIDFETGAGAEIAAVMSLLEGHAEYVMNHVPYAVLPGRRRLMAALRRRRDVANPLQKLVRHITGLDAKLAQYSDGVAFVSAVVDEVGHEGLNMVWADPLNVPGRSEIDSPRAWINRVLG
ncbi:MAG: hypothetical protein E7Z96_06870 [Actinomycetaceae bacterium]|nr:hypothetical protein [Actinomycetaceae bacterium]